MGQYTIKPLTKMAIDRMKVGETLSDTAENAGLRVTRGKKNITFYYRYRDSKTKKLKRVNIGHLDTVSLAEARVILANMKKAKKLGLDPASAKPKSKAQPVEEIDVGTGISLKEIINSYLNNHVYKNRKLKGAKETDRVLTNCAIELMGDKPAGQMTRRDILELINNEMEKGHSAQAGVLLRELVAAFETGILSGTLPDDFVNPALLAKQSLRTSSKKLTSTPRKRVLTDNELTLWMQWVMQPKIVSEIHRTAMLLALRTACRTGEAISAEWKDIDLKKGTWYLPETKTGVSRTIILPKQVIAYLKTLQSYKNKSKWLCPSPRTDRDIHVQQKSITERLWLEKRNNRLPAIDHWVPHDLRRTARTILAKLGCPHEIAEAALGHTKGGIAGVYNLHQYEKEVGQWLQKLNTHIDKVCR